MAGIYANNETKVISTHHIENKIELKRRIK